MSDTLNADIRTSPSTLVQEKAELSKREVRPFIMLAIPLALLLLTFRVYRLEQPAFFSLACLVFGGFAVFYWLPVRFRQTFRRKLTPFRLPVIRWALEQIGDHAASVHTPCKCPLSLLKKVEEQTL
jgi:hypothetical protein